MEFISHSQPSADGGISGLPTAAPVPGGARTSDPFFRNLLAASAAMLSQWPLQDRAALLGILQHNLETGRVQRAVASKHPTANDGDEDQEVSEQRMPETGAPETLAELSKHWPAYHQRVVDVYRQEQTRMNALTASDPQAWRVLWEQLNRRAYQLLVQKGIGAEFAREKSAEIAQQACERVFVSVFPCDVPFDYWVQTILKNVVLHYLTRSRDLLDRQPALNSLDELDDGSLNRRVAEVTVVAGSAPVRDIAAAATEMQALVDAIERMRSEEWRAVIVYTYFTGLSDEEIASRLGRTKGSVQTIRHRALKQLRALYGD